MTFLIFILSHVIWKFTQKLQPILFQYCCGSALRLSHTITNYNERNRVPLAFTSLEIGSPPRASKRDIFTAVCTDRPLGVPHSPVILMQCKSHEYHATLKMCCITLLWERWAPTKESRNPNKVWWRSNLQILRLPQQFCTVNSFCCTASQQKRELDRLFVLLQ